MPVNQYPVIDGIAPSWADIAVKLKTTGGVLLDVYDIKALNTGTSLETGEARNGGVVYKRTMGSASQEASFTLYHEGLIKLLRGLKDAAPLRGKQRLLRVVHFNISAIWTPPGSSEIFEVRLKGCHYGGRTLNGSEGTDATEAELPLNPIQIADVVDGEEVVIL